ncbi:uncharacterized protein LOC142048476 isoform X19 [Phalacrocorax aristotelis]|uniref:uncharacterized protein LOC142048476 isoform X19 n=1 Tax=Phalacrocorax aristotelis TaxID=126867 RepID=UPI003F4C809D
MKCNSLPSHVADAIDVVEELCLRYGLQEQLYTCVQLFFLSADLCHHLPWNLLEKGMCITCAHNNNVWTGVCLLLQSQYGYPRASLLLRNGTRISASTVTRGRKLLLQDTSVCLCVFFLRFAWDQRLRFLSHQIQVFRAYKQAPDVDTDPGGTAREMYSREPDTEGRRGSEHREKVLCWLPLKLDEHLCVTDGFVSSLWFFYLRVPCDEPSGIWALEVLCRGFGGETLHAAERCCLGLSTAVAQPAAMLPLQAPAGPAFLSSQAGKRGCCRNSYALRLLLRLLARPQQRTGC